MPNEENKSGAQKAAEAEVEIFRKDLGRLSSPLIRQSDHFCQ
jgi:hypothetical protein